MDEKALNKLLQIIEILTKMKAENSKNKQGFTDRLIVAKDIYKRNKEDSEFTKNLNSNINDNNEEIYELIINYK